MTANAALLAQLQTLLLLLLLLLLCVALLHLTLLWCCNLPACMLHLPEPRAKQHKQNTVCCLYPLALATILRTLYSPLAWVGTWPLVGNIKLAIML